MSYVKVLRIGFIAILFCSFTALNAQDKDLKSLAEAYVAAWNSGSTDGFDALLSADFKRHAPPSSAAPMTDGLEAMKQVVNGAHATFEGFNVVIDEVIVGDNRYVMRWTYSGTHTGEGNPGLAGKQVKDTGISVVHVADGKMVEEWAVWDNLATMMQLGMTVVPKE